MNLLIYKIVIGFASCLTFNNISNYINNSIVAYVFADRTLRSQGS